MDKRLLAAAALRAIADKVQHAPLTRPIPDRRYTADMLLEAILTGTAIDPGFLIDVVPDPTAEDGLVDYCRICESDHEPDCPVAILEWLAATGLTSPEPVPAAYGRWSDLLC